MYLFRVTLMIFAIVSCKPEQPATEFGSTSKVESGENKELSTNKNQPINFSYKIEENSDAKEAKLVVVKQPKNGKLENCLSSSNNEIRCNYVPNENFVGLDYIYFKMENGDFDSEKTSYVKILVKGQPELGQDISINVQANDEIIIEFPKASDNNPEDILKYVITKQPGQGTLEDCKEEDDLYKCVYRPNQDVVGSDVIEYKVTDNEGLETPVGLIDINILEYCNSYKRLSIFLDKNGNEKIDEDENLGEISSFLGNLSAADNYNYYSASAHPIVGPAPSGYAGNVFLYEGSDGLTLNMIFNKDNGGNTQTWNDVKWEVVVKDNQKMDSVLISDENGELSFEEESELSPGDAITNTILANNLGVSADTSTDPLKMWKRYIGDWHYKANTDGGVIGPLVGEDFEVMIKMIDKGDVKDINFHSSRAEDDVFLLSPEESNEETVFFLKYHDTEVCEVYDQNN